VAGDPFSSSNVHGGLGGGGGFGPPAVSVSFQTQQMTNLQRNDLGYQARPWG
jgi:hypothetical protein